MEDAVPLEPFLAQLFGLGGVDFYQREGENGSPSANERVFRIMLAVCPVSVAGGGFVCAVFVIHFAKKQ